MSPLLKLEFLAHKNIGVILHELGHNKEALEELLQVGQHSCWDWDC